MFELTARDGCVRSLYVVMALMLLLVAGCATRPVSKRMETTAYCGCGQCCGWERASWKYLKLDFWNRYVTSGSSSGRNYTGLTSSGTTPREPHPGLFSMDSIKRPWVIPFRIVLFPWLFMPQDGTIAADTKYYRFGTRMYVPGYGWGVVEDRGSAIKGADRLDLYMETHSKALSWGRRKLSVQIEK